MENKSSLLPLNPFIHDDDTIRVGGRVTYSSLRFSQKHPIILPKDNTFSLLLVRQIHLETLHGGIQLMLQTLRQKYWIIHSRQVVKKVIHQCVTCRKFRGATLTQQMGSLPKQRVTPSRPFLASGVDYCGPFNIRVGGPRSKTTVKTYIAIFVCMATKAVHIEVVEDLSSRAFLDAFARFVSRRGRCLEIFSDNATNFHGANRMLKEDLKDWMSEQTQQGISNVGTTWKFISPRSPHQGGLWEAAVKSAKRHMIKIIGAQKLWLCQMQTLMTKIEACLNSRPLISLKDSSDDRMVLTPGDFLIGEPLLAIPEPKITDVPISRLKQWQYLRKLHQEFWNRWSKDYLSTLQIRSKWFQKINPLKINDVVAIKDETRSPTFWKIARVIAIHPGKDGLVRTVTLKSASGEYTRAVQQICLILEDDVLESGDSTGQNV